MRQITEVVGEMGEKMRNRQRSVGRRLIEIGRASRGRGPQMQKKLEQGYRKLLGSTGPVVAQAKRFSQEIGQGVKRSSDVLQQAALEDLKKEIDTMLPRVQQVVRQTRARIFQGITNSAGKIVSLFEHTTEIIRKGKPGKPRRLAFCKIWRGPRLTLLAISAENFLACPTTRLVTSSNLL